MRILRFLKILKEMLPRPDPVFPDGTRYHMGVMTQISLAWYLSNDEI